MGNRSIGLTLQKCQGCNMTEKGPKTLIKSKRPPHTDQYRKCNCSRVRNIHCTGIAMGLKIFRIAVYFAVNQK